MQLPRLNLHPGLNVTVCPCGGSDRDAWRVEAGCGGVTAWFFHCRSDELPVLIRALLQDGIAALRTEDGSLAAKLQLYPSFEAHSWLLATWQRVLEAHPQLGRRP